MRIPARAAWPRLALAVLLAPVLPAMAEAGQSATASASSEAGADTGRPGGTAAPGMGEEIVVTGTRSPRPMRDVPEAVTVLPRTEIERSPSKTVDELLRIVPSFGLFRRTSSVVSDPSAQGVNLRGVGPSGVSRSLVLVDGVPANDPFGGWVYWRAIPRLDIDRVEVVPGGGSALYGNYALGGVTQVFSRPIAPSVAGALECGSFESCTVAARGANRWGPVGAMIGGELLSSQGYPLVAGSARGPVDSDDAPSLHANVNARVEASVTPALSLTARGGYFHEDENGGTRFTTAGVRRAEYAATARYAPESAGALELTVFGHEGRFDQQRAAFTAVEGCEDRCGERLGASQEVPVHDIGAALLYTSRSLALAGRHTLTLGGDIRRIRGDTREDLFPATVTPASVVGREAGGVQWLYGVFAQDVYDVTDALAVTAALRYDRWENVDASRVERRASGVAESVVFPRRSDDALSPKVGLRLRLLEVLRLRAAAYGSFRAPTLNELYRPFQVGTIRTDANENLGPETLRGAEAGLDVTIKRGFGARLTGFWSVLDDPITNVTVGPDLRQRQNLGRARIRGIEAEAGWRLGRRWLATLAYTFVDSRITEAPGQPGLVGRQLPQDPRHRGSLSLAFDDPRLFSAAMQIRYIGRQFEDDLNERPLGRATLVDVSLRRRVGTNVELVLAVENLLDEEYLVGNAGVETVGQPRFVHGGVRFRYGE